MSIKKIFQEWQETQRVFDRAHREIHRRMIEEACAYVQRGRRFENTSVRELVALHEEAQHRCYGDGDKSYSQVLDDIDSEFAARGLDASEFVTHLYLGQLFAKIVKKRKKGGSRLGRRRTDGA